MRKRTIRANVFVARFVLAAALFLSFSIHFSSAQSLDALRLQRESAENEIRLLDAQLEKLSTSKKDLAKELSLTLQRSKKLQSVVNSIDSQLKILDGRKSTQSRAAQLLSDELLEMRDLLSKDVKQLYLIKLSLSDSGLFLNDSLRSRYAYLHTASELLASSINNRTEEINSIQGDLGKELREIATRRTELAQLRSDQSVALSEIKSQQKRIEELSKEVSTSEVNLVKQREQKAQDLSSLQAKIEELIRAEMLKNAPSKGEPTTADELSREQLDSYSNSFVAQGSSMLPPVIGGKILAKFGLNADTEQAGVKLQNNGLNLQSSPSSNVMVVADGQVRKVFVIGTLGTSVLVRHGQYLTVYSNLGSTSVVQGQRVVKGEKIGKLGDDGTLHFEVWHETTPQNPEKWIKF